jgi:hypothetical protein
MAHGKVRLVLMQAAQPQPGRGTDPDSSRLSLQAW